MLKYKSKNLIILFMVTILFSACTQKFEGLTVQESKKYPVTIVSASKITCSDGIRDVLEIEEGSIFIPQDISEKEYSILSMMNPFSVMMTDSSNKFPKKALFLDLDSSSIGTMGLIIYPNGKFVYENYHIAMYDFVQNRWMLFSDISCKANSDTAFEMRNKLNKKKNK